MQDSAIYQKIEEYAREHQNEEELTVYHLLYGYAKLLAMDDDTLDLLFTGDSDHDEIRRIRAAFDDSGLNLSLTRQALPVLLERNVFSRREDVSKLAEEISKNEADAGKEDDPFFSSQMLQAILKQDVPEFSLLKNDHSLEDVFTYIDQQEPAPAPKRRPAPGAGARGRARARARAKEADSPVQNAESGSSRRNAEESKQIDFQRLIARTRNLDETLRGRVLGQEDAVRKFVQGFFQSEIFRNAEKGNKHPAATFLLAGPPGVGKTFLAETFAEIMGYPFKKFDMSGFSRPSNVSSFIGDEQTYKDAKQGVVTEYVQENPECLLIFDEIEKSHPEVIQLFLQILDAGNVTDRFTQEQVSFENAIIIFTTNVGRKLFSDDTTTNLTMLPTPVIMKALQDEEDRDGNPIFPAEICSRLSAGNVIMFNHLSARVLLDIVNKRFSWFCDTLKETYDFDLVIDPRVSTVFLFNQSTYVDARIASSQSVIMLKNELYELGRNVDRPDRDFKSLKTISLNVAVPEEACEVRDLLVNDRKFQVLILADPEGWQGNSARFAPIFAETQQDAMKILSEEDIDFVVLDPAYGSLDPAQKYLSMEDWDSEGARCFHQIRRDIPGLPVYLTDSEEMDTEDRNTFSTLGARGFIHSMDADGRREELEQICDELFLQNSINRLSGRGRVLDFNTRQTVSEDGTQADITFYDLKIRVAASAEDRQILMSEEDKPKEKFSDVIGADSAKEELEYFIDFLKNPKKFAAQSVKLAKGILLYGPPGTGKTMLARAMAGEAGVSFFPCAATDFMKRYVGEGEKTIRDLFTAAKRYAPSIIFIDEIDAIGKERTGSDSKNSSEVLLNTLLTEMDGFQQDASKPVFVLAATNFDLDGTRSGKDSRIDPALIRRFDNRIFVDLPNEENREQYLKLRLEQQGIDTVGKETIHNIAERTTGESLAILQNIIALAERNAAKQGTELNDEILLNALEEFMYGDKKEWDEDYYRKVAAHEAGHAYISWLSGIKPSFVTIVSRGDFGGYMQPDNSENTPSYTREQILGQIRTCLAGRASEIVFFGDKDGINTGVSSDLQRATDWAMRMLCSYGMGENMLVSFSPKTILSSSLGPQYISQAEEILQEEMKNTIELVREGKSQIEALQNLLLQKNQAMGDEILAVFENES